jgi:hypothetical protein
VRPSKVIVQVKFLLVVSYMRSAALPLAVAPPRPAADPPLIDRRGGIGLTSSRIAE